MVTANYFARFKYLHKIVGRDSHDMYECSALFNKLCNKEAVLVFRLEYDWFPSYFRKTQLLRLWGKNEGKVVSVHTMDSWRGVEVEFHAFITLALVGVEWLSSRSWPHFTWYQFNRPHSHSRRFGKEKYLLLLTGIRQISRSPSPQPRPLYGCGTQPLKKGAATATLT
jgi:hypothetical protein